VELLRDADRWQAASAAARTRAARFDVETVVPQYEELYGTVVGR
jgi:hypothetical protein